MLKTYRITHDISSNTIELATLQDGAQVHCQNYHPSQRDELLAASAGEAQAVVDAAGWTDAHIASVLAAEYAVAHPFTPSVVSDAIAKTYSDVDAIYAMAIGNRAEEYKQAEADARAYAAAGYTGTPTAYVSGWAAAKGLTSQQSADAIIARADALVAAKLSLRNQRFTSQAAMSAATTRAELDTAVAAWNAFVAATKVALA